MTNEPGSRVRIDADDRRTGMTLGELRGFVDLAAKVGMPDGAAIKVTAGFRQQMQRIEVHRG